MTCQHPNCFQPRHSICTNHCHWSLCQEHFNEHRNSLLVEFQQVLEELIQPTNELIQSIEQSKINYTENQQKELDDLKQIYQKELNEIEQKLIDIKQFENQLDKISKHLIKIKNNEQILTQNHFQEINFLLEKINQYKNPLIDEEEPEKKEILQNQCPLTSLNVYGLSSSHNIRLCSAHREVKYLYNHFRNYHHLTIDYANKLTDAIKRNLNPMKTKIFPPDTQIVDTDTKYRCPLHNTSKQSGIRSTPCSTFITKKTLRFHLQTTHDLQDGQITELIKLT